MVENIDPENNERELLHLSGRFTNAVDYARHLHIERRKGTEIPYMAHLLGVAALVMGESGHAWLPVTEDMVIAALLHDAAEDHGGSLRVKDIDYNFGSDVARMVMGLSDSPEAKPDQKDSWPERKRAYIQKLQGEPADVRLISVADKLYNARAILEDYREIQSRIWKRFNRNREDQLWYFDALLKIYQSFAAIRIVGEFGRVLTELRLVSATDSH